MGLLLCLLSTACLSLMMPLPARRPRPPIGFSPCPGRRPGGWEQR